MTISAVATALTSGSGTAASNLSSLSGNEQTFLQLLTTQLQNQDPLNPTDTSTFTQQLVEYSQVEQQINTNSKLDNVTKLLVSNELQNALSTVGAYVQYTGSNVDFTQGSTSTVSYTLPSTAASNDIFIQDSNGNVVYTQEIPFTDFPLDEVKLYFANNVIHLPSEY